MTFVTRALLLLFLGSAVFLTIRLAVPEAEFRLDPQAALRLLDDMREIAHARNEPALWEQWANAATNIVTDLPSHDPQGNYPLPLATGRDL